MHRISKGIFVPLSCGCIGGASALESWSRDYFSSKIQWKRGVFSPDKKGMRGDERRSDVSSPLLNNRRQNDTFLKYVPMHH